MTPYGVMADLHAHSWSQFAGVTAEGVNTRLMEILNEVDRCCQAVLDAGGYRVVLAGDIFHTRGKVTPSVFNPVRDTIARWKRASITFRVIPGNHDLESRDSKELTSAVAMLGGEEDNWIIEHKPYVGGSIALVPWIDKQADLLKAIESVATGFVAKRDLFLHAGIDGVLSGMPDHGLTASKLAGFGFRRVFAGHYHNHKDMGQGVYSIGAPSHQTWSDVGTKAGWLIVTDEKVTWHASHAPSFIDIDGTVDADELPLIVDGHYVRAKIGKATSAEVEHWRRELAKMGARGSLIQSTPVAAPVRVGSLASGLSSLPATISAFCEDRKLSNNVAGLALSILGEVA